MILPQEMVAFFLFREFEKEIQRGSICIKSRKQHKSISYTWTVITYSVSILGKKEYLRSIYLRLIIQNNFNIKS